jgi:hypothetical protein
VTFSKLSPPEDRDALFFADFIERIEDNSSRWVWGTGPRDGDPRVGPEPPVGFKNGGRLAARPTYPHAGLDDSLKEVFGQVVKAIRLVPKELRHG